MTKPGRPKKGSKEEQIIRARDEEIRRRYREGDIGTLRLSREYGISRSRIQQILKEE